MKKKREHAPYYWFYEEARGPKPPYHTFVNRIKLGWTFEQAIQINKRPNLVGMTPGERLNKCLEKLKFHREQADKYSRMASLDY